MYLEARLNSESARGGTCDMFYYHHGACGTDPRQLLFLCFRFVQQDGEDLFICANIS